MCRRRLAPGRSRSEILSPLTGRPILCPHRAPYSRQRSLDNGRRLGLPMPAVREQARRPPRSRTSPERLPWLRYDRMARAVIESLRVRPVSGQPFWVLVVRNPVHRTHYQVCLPEYPSGEARFCSCPDFARRGIGTCKHVEAATAWLASHPEVGRPATARRGVADTWRAIDAAQRAASSDDRPASLRLRASGRVLFEQAVGRRSAVGKTKEPRRGSAGPADRSAA